MPNQPEDHEPAGTAAPLRKTRHRIDWTRGARLLGRGEQPGAVAAALGVAEERLWRHLKASRRFRRLLDETINLHGFTLGLQSVLTAGGDPAPEAGDKPEQSEIRKNKEE